MGRVNVPEGVGLGLRYSFAHEVILSEDGPEWFEIAPENWMGRDFPLVCHGLSLSIGSPDPLNVSFLR